MTKQHLKYLSFILLLLTPLISYSQTMSWRWWSNQALVYDYTGNICIGPAPSPCSVMGDWTPSGLFAIQ